MRSYYGILARPKERLPYKTDGEFKVEWLANELPSLHIKPLIIRFNNLSGLMVIAVTEGSIIMPGLKSMVDGGNNIEVVSNSEGISVTHKW
ncbi:hypothetical protein NSU02_16655 [Aeribacillus sp. FSL W8-0870]|uniref:hypothetical protein n=1 Tax=Aeribacillus sp. FSL W8-0870 TaxID=2954706 RepID=UPI0030D074C1